MTTTKQKDNDKDDKEYSMPTGVKIFVILYGIFSMLFEGWMALFSLALGLLCGYQCAKFAQKIKGKKNLAFIIGYVFVLSGLLLYWIYYLIRRHYIKRKANRGCKDG